MSLPFPFHGLRKVRLLYDKALCLLSRLVHCFTAVTSTQFVQWSLCS